MYGAQTQTQTTAQYSYIEETAILFFIPLMGR